MEAVVTLGENSPEVKYLSARDKRLAKAISMIGTISYIPHNDEYAFLIHEIIEQMLSIKAGRKIYERLETLCGARITPQSVSALSDEAIRSTGTSNAKVSYIRTITDAVLSGSLCFDKLRELSDEAVIKELTALRGIGTWTTKMYLIFVLDRQDVLPFEDGAFLQSYRWLYNTTDSTPASVKKKCAKWKPYSSIAARYLYRILDLGLTKEDFHLFK